MTFWRSCSCLNAAAQVAYSVDTQMVLTLVYDTASQTTHLNNQHFGKRCYDRNAQFVLILNYTYTNATFAHRQAS